MFFAQSKTGKHDENVPNMLAQEKSNIQSGSVQKMSSLSNSTEEDQEKQTSADAASVGDGKENLEGGEISTVEE